MNLLDPSPVQHTRSHPGRGARDECLSPRQPGLYLAPVRVRCVLATGRRRQRVHVSDRIIRVVYLSPSPTGPWCCRATCQRRACPPATHIGAGAGAGGRDCVRGVEDGGAKTWRYQATTSQIARGEYRECECGRDLRPPQCSAWQGLRSVTARRETSKNKQQSSAPCR